MSHEQYIVPELADEPDFEIPGNFNFSRSPDDLMQAMGRAAWEHEYANRKLRDIQSTITIRVKQLKIILLARRIDLIQNEKLRGHLISCFEDLKFRFTADILDSFIYVEQRELMQIREKYEAIAKQAEKEHDMWQKQLSWHQSKIKLKIAELENNHLQT